MSKSRLIINNVRNFKITLILVMVVLFISGAIISLSTAFLFGVVTLTTTTEESINKLQVENEALKMQIAMMEEEHKIYIDNLVVAHEEEIQIKDSLLEVVDDALEVVEYYYTEYHYIFRDAASAKNPMKLSHVMKLDEEAKNRNIDPHLLASIIFLESRYNIDAKNSQSTATGLGQILRSTGKYIHENIQGYKTPYSHDMALDPLKNIEMMAAYVEYLYRRNSSTDAMLKAYSGDCIGPEYQRRVYSYMKENVGYANAKVDLARAN